MVFPVSVEGHEALSRGVVSRSSRSASSRGQFFVRPTVAAFFPGVNLLDALRLVGTMALGGTAATMVALGVLHARTLPPSERRDFSSDLAREGHEASLADRRERSPFLQELLGPEVLEAAKAKELADLIALLTMATSVASLQSGAAALCAPRRRAHDLLVRELSPRGAPAGCST